MEWTGLASCLLLLLMDSPRYARGQVVECSPELQVPRNKIYKAIVRESLKITCPVKLCGQTFNFTWCRLDNSGTCKPLDKTATIINGWTKPEEARGLEYLFLLFENISLIDAGQYRCGIIGLSGSSVSHSIIVHVAATRNETLNDGNEIDSHSASASTEDEHNSYDWIPYFSICTIIVAVVVIVMVISFLCVQACKGSQKSRNSDESHCQFKVSQDKPGISTDHHSSRVHSNQRDRCEGSIIYATLNHQSKQEDSASTSIALEGHTEYATIRVS
ncbi:hypothetical protein GJAV_G00253600 [Gymnothorax javanicus]|nr:hypothetical protein GJAV_G00253600 [Gymnothorax javanicus]